VPRGDDHEADPPPAVLLEGRLVGIVSSGDILALELAERQETIEYLNQYILAR